jgi:YegS/Rv2252/BmrU family lipid kinase
MKRNFIYFINPISGTKNKDLLLRMIETRTKEQQIPFQVLATRADSDYSFLPEKIRTEKITDIIVCGGDGTVNQVAASLLNCKVNIGIIPMGSGNGLALAAGIPANRAKALDVIFKGHSASVDGFYINGIFSCMLCGLGFDAQVAHDFAEQPKRGLVTYAKQTMKNFMSATPYHFKLKMEEREIEEDAFFISIANSNQFGNHVTIAPKASISDGLLDIVVVKKMSKLRLIYSLLKQIKLGRITNTERKFHQDDILYLQTEKLAISNPMNAPLHIDGDPAATSAQFEIEIIPRAFCLIQP